MDPRASNSRAFSPEESAITESVRALNKVYAVVRDFFKGSAFRT
jgi:hypothetical protein